MRSKILAASFAILFAHSIAAAAPAAAPLPMTPTGPWKVEFADSMCLLSRPFGKDGATTLVLKPNMLGNGMEIIVSRARHRSIAPSTDKLPWTSRTKG